MGKYQFNWSKIKTDIKKSQEQKASFGDSRLWKMKIDENKKGSAVIRFLPDRNGTPFKQYFSHWFEFETNGKGVQKYIENCATTIKMPCPICTKNRELFNSSYKVDQDVARERKRRVHFVSNIFVLRDEANPTNEGKVFLYDYGPQIYAKVKKAMFGPEEDDPDFDSDSEPDTFIPCDLYDGADFLLRSTLKKGTENAKVKWNTYEASKFRNTSKIFPDLDDIEWEEAVDRIMESTHDLSEWDRPSIYPVEQTVIVKLGHILGVSNDSPEDDQDDNVSQVNVTHDHEGDSQPDREEIQVDESENVKHFDDDSKNFEDDESFLSDILKKKKSD